MNLENLTTERRNENTMGLDEMSVKEALQKMNQEDQKVAMAVGQELAAIEPVVEAIIKSFNQGGRLIYMGAGTSGRLGVLDAAECVPTFGVEPEMVQLPHRWWSKSNDCRSRGCRRFKRTRSSRFS